MAMIIRFQLGTLCMRNKETKERCSVLIYFPRITRLQLCVIGNHSRYDIPTHTLSSLSSETNLGLIVQLFAIATNSR